MKKIFFVLFFMSLVVSVSAQIKFSELPQAKSTDDVELLVGVNNKSHRLKKDSLVTAEKLYPTIVTNVLPTNNAVELRGYYVRGTQDSIYKISSKGVSLFVGFIGRQTKTANSYAALSTSAAIGESLLLPTGEYITKVSVKKWLANKVISNTVPPKTYIVNSDTIDNSFADIEYNGLKYEFRGNKLKLKTNQLIGNPNQLPVISSSLYTVSAQLTDTTDNSIYEIRGIANNVQRWHKINSIITSSSVLPVDSFASGSNVIYNYSVKRYGVSTDPKQYKEYLNLGKGWEAVEGRWYIEDFGVMPDGVTNATIAIQNAIDSAGRSLKGLCIIEPKYEGRFKLNSPIYLRRTNTFGTVILRGLGGSYTASTSTINESQKSGFQGSVLEGTFSDSSLIYVVGGRRTIIEGWGMKGVNTIGYINDTTMIQASNYVVVGLNAAADQRYTTNSAVCIDCITGQTLFSSETAIRNCYIVNFVTGIANNTVSDGSGDYTSVENTTIERCKFGFSGGNTQMRITSIDKCIINYCWKSIVNNVHGVQQGRVNSVTNCELGGNYYMFDITGGAVQGALYCSNLYSETGMIIGRIDAPANFTSCNFDLGAGQANSLYVAPQFHLQTSGKASHIRFESCTFFGGKSLGIHNTAEASVEFVDCNIVINANNGETTTQSGSAVFQGALKAIGGVWCSDPNRANFTQSKTTETNNYYGTYTDRTWGDRGYISNLYYNSINCWTNKDLRYQGNSNGQMRYNVFLSKFVATIFNASVNFVGTRFAFQNQGWGVGQHTVGDVFINAQGLCFALTEVRSDSFITTLMNNYHYSNTGAFIKYVNPILITGGSLTGNSYIMTSNRFITVRQLYGDYTSGSQTITNLKNSDGTAFNPTSFLVAGTPLEGGAEFNNKVLNHVAGILALNSTTITSSQGASRTCTQCPVGNTFREIDAIYFTTIHKESALVKSYIQTGLSATTVDVSAGCQLTGQGYSNFVSNDFTNVTTMGRKIKVYTITASTSGLAVYNTTPSSTTGLTWQISGTTISVYLGATLQTINSINVDIYF